MGRADARRGASADDVALAAGDHPLHADDAVPSTAQGPAAVGAGAGARAHPRARRARRAHRRAAGECAGRQGGRPAGRVVDRRWPRQRRRAGRGGEGAGGRSMMDVTVNIPEVVAEVRALFERYEQALIDKNVDVLDATFWDSPRTIRYSFHEHGYGFAKIHAHRVARPPGPGTKEKRIRLEILTLGRDLATVNLEFKVRGQDAIGRQSQMWVRFPDLGWRVVSAHVSAISAPPPR